VHLVWQLVRWISKHIPAAVYRSLKMAVNEPGLRGPGPVMEIRGAPAGISS
jgi:hypothetical protein